MRYLIFSDLHANKRALEDLQKYLSNNKIGKIICCGDIIGFGEEINEAINFVRNHCESIKGNHERLLLGELNLQEAHPVVKQSIEETLQIITQENLQWLSHLPDSYEDEVLTCIHTLDLDRYIYEEQAEEFLKEFNTKYLFTGHTHCPYIRKFENQYVVNVGSITKGRKGFPRSFCTLQNSKLELITMENFLWPR